MAGVLGFVLHLKGIGLWIGLNVGSVLQSSLLSLITSSTNWEKEVDNTLNASTLASLFSQKSSANSHSPLNNDVNFLLDQIAGNNGSPKNTRWRDSG